MQGMDGLKRFAETLRRRREEQDAWASANPELAVAWDEAIGEDQERRAQAERLRERASAMRRTGAPERALEIIVRDAVRDTAAVRAVREWLNGGSTFLVLTGGTGAGKTLAACLALEKGGRFERAVAAGRLGLYGDEDVARMKALRETRMLVLDDLGAEFAGDVWRAQFDELVDERYGNRLGTVITTNLSPAALKERYGARVADRIRHDGQVVACGSESLRAPGGGS